MAPQDPNLSDREFSDSDSSDGSDYDDAVEKPQRRITGALFDKDSDEEELERMVLGDTAGFRENLFKNNGSNDTYNLDGQGLLEESGEYEDVADADLFMLDTGMPGVTQSTTVPATKTDNVNAPVWVDSDDEKLAISLAGTTRLRKLRLTEAEDVVSGTEYCKRLRQQYLRLNPAPAWAQEAQGRPIKRRRRSSANSGSDSDFSDDNGELSAQPLQKFLRDINSLKGETAANRRLRPEVLDIQRTREIPDRHKAAVECLSFHPEYPVLLSASSASILHLHHIAPEAQPTPNPRLTSVQIKQVDVRQAQFLYPKGDKVVFGGRRKYFHSWDLPSGVVDKVTQVLGHRLEHKTMERFKLSPCGRYMGIIASTKKGGGIINVVSVGSMQWIAAARLASRNGIADFAWWSTGDGMTILGKDGQVGEYSMERKRFLGIWNDDGCVGGVVIALGGHQGPIELGDDRWVAVGSNSGITNIYDRSELLAPPQKNTAQEEEASIIMERPTPTRTFEQLITPITTVSFSLDGQLMAFASQHKKDALRLVHLPSCTVYRNWPTEQTPLGRITAVAFNRESNVLAVGNQSGKIRLWDIRN